MVAVFIQCLYLSAALFFITANLALADSFQGGHNLGWASFRNLSPASFQEKLIEYKIKGYRPFNVKITGGSNKKYTIIFLQNTEGLGWGIHTTLTSSQFAAKWNEYKEKGYMPVDIETYSVSGNKYFAGIWIKNRENRKWASHRNQSSESFAKKYVERITT